MVSSSENPHDYDYDYDYDFLFDLIWKTLEYLNSYADKIRYILIRRRQPPALINRGLGNGVDLENTIEITHCNLDYLSQAISKRVGSFWGGQGCSCITFSNSLNFEVDTIKRRAF